MKFDVINLDGKSVGDISLSEAVFGLEERKDLLHRVVNWQLAKYRQGSAKTQVRSEVSRTKAKWFKQKGTGRARHGARTANLFVGGATQFGPRPKDWSFSLNKKVRILALKTALSSKAGRKDLIIIDEAKLKSHKTKELAAKLEKLNASHATFIVDSVDSNFELATRNLPHIKVLPSEGANVYDILHKDKLVITQEAVKMLEGRLVTDKTDTKKTSSKKVEDKPVAKKATAKKSTSAKKADAKIAAPKGKTKTAAKKVTATKTTVKKESK